MNALVKLNEKEVASNVDRKDTDLMNVPMNLSKNLNQSEEVVSNVERMATNLENAQILSRTTRVLIEETTDHLLWIQIWRTESILEMVQLMNSPSIMQIFQL